MKLPIKYHDGKKIENIRSAIRAAARRYSGRPAIMQKFAGAYREISYAELLYKVEGLGTELLSLGFSGKKIMILGDNSLEWATVFLTCISGLGVVVPVDKDSPAVEIELIAAKTDAAAIFYSPRFEEKISSLSSGIKKYSFNTLEALIEEGTAKLSCGDTDYLRLSVDPDDLAAICFNPSSSGEPHGIMLSQRNVCFDLSELTRTVICYPEDVFLSVLPINHIYELICGFLYPLISGACVAFCEGLRYMSRNIQEVRPTVMVCVPYLLETIHRKIKNNIRLKGSEKKVRAAIKLTGSSFALKKRVFNEIHDSLGGRLRLFISGGSIANPDIIRGLREFGFRTLQSYGLTDTLPLISISTDFAYNDSSVGVCVPDGIIDIYDIGGDGIGEIRYKGDNIISGILGNGSQVSSYMRDGWLYTGDLGHIDRDGFLYISGKKKNVFVTATGKNIFPEELEALLRRNRFVNEAVVVGYVNESREDYDIVAVLRPEVSEFEEVYGKQYSRGQVDAEFNRAIEEVNRSVAPFKKIHFFVTRRRDFELTQSRKVRRSGVAEEAKAEYLRKLART
ncbi:MAG: AMP-binding protein [Clostridia bacterium]|nr:AMP-binding protein [Clostridia bacterium]